MKRKVFLAAMLCAFLMAGMISCEKEDLSSNEMNVTVCGIKNPTWLTSKINAAPQDHPIAIYTYKDTEGDIVAFESFISSDSSKGISFLDCSGKEFELNSEQYNKYYKLFVDNKFKLSWTNFVKVNK